MRQQGFTVRASGQLDHAVETISERPVDLILSLRPPLDMLLEWAGKLRAQSGAPLVLILESPPISLQLACLRAGADLVLDDPADPRLVAAYCLKLARRAASIPGKALPDLQAGELILDPSSRSVKLGDSEPQRLTQLEFRLLYLLLSHQGQVIEIEDLVERVWGYGDAGTQDLVRGLVSRLRKKLGETSDSPTYIETIPGVGYRLRSE